MALSEPKVLLRLSVVVALLTIVLKSVAGYLTNSMGLISDAMESFVNLAGASFALAMVSIAARPADEGHPYGHHKAEYFSSGFEGALILGAGCAIVAFALMRLWRPEPLEQLGWGTALSVLSAAFNAGMAWLLLRGSRSHKSIALEADARHLIADVWTTVGVLVGVGVVALTGWLWLDALVAVAVGLNILFEGARLVWRSSQGLMDAAIDPAAQAALQEALERFKAAVPDGQHLRFDDIVTRSAGRRAFADLHMHVPGDWSLERAATLRDGLERALIEAVPGLRVTIQLLPLNMEPRVGLMEQEA
ncbi:cation diffusion facilitator family transporter [Variovorax dokdonensis]|uniref:Cation diffusion facilitator family transporter n=1 Tax=Variovorax dokdonensis TaxID=344883 RepID=A0ABT7N527_9BURK|nr:cation diffusion facilitator family transporter [Variovorax dokdonensis]MDM0043020.1 cation diffusion facilitator family transporter [Variovorax dokdonensis]